MEKVPFSEFMKDQGRGGFTGSTTMGRKMAARLLRNRLALWGLLFLTAVVLAAAFAPFISPYDPATQNLLERLHPPSSSHWLGTDEYGRDIFSRLLYGARISLLVGFSSVAGAMFIGTVIGAVSGYYGGWLDQMLMRLVDLFNAFPSIFLLITIVTLLEPNITNIVAVFMLLGWTGTARLVRGEFLKLKEEEFVWAARSIGVSDMRIIFVHMLPNAAAPIIVAATLGMGGVILAESGLSFLGLGIQPPVPSWGNMLQGAQSLSIMVLAPWYPLFPGVMILMTVLAFNFVGDGLRDALDPKI